jgi:hypothetical protein
MVSPSSSLYISSSPPGPPREILQGAKRQEGAHESPKSPIALATEVFLNCFLLFGGVFLTICSLFRNNNYVKFI